METPLNLKRLVLLMERRFKESAFVTISFGSNSVSGDVTTGHEVSTQVGSDSITQVL
jgi:hypothetical protein